MPGVAHTDTPDQIEVFLSRGLPHPASLGPLDLNGKRSSGCLGYMLKKQGSVGHLCPVIEE
jgi:hypothetical protein